MLTDQQTIELVQRTNPVPDMDRLPEPRYDALELLEVAQTERAMGTIPPRVRPATQHSPGRRWLRPVTAFWSFPRPGARRHRRGHTSQRR